MKKSLYILALAALVLSCAREVAPDAPATGEKVTIKAALPDGDDTKVSLTEATDRKSIALAWEAEDAISVNSEPFTIKSGFTAHEAEFEGKAPSGDSYNIIYPGKYATPEAVYARSYTGQVQTGNSSTAHLEYNAALVGVSAYAEPKFDSEWAAAKGGSLLQNAVLQLRLQLPEGTASATGVTLSASRAIFPTTNEGTELVREISLGLKDVTLPANRILEAYMMVSAAGVTIRDGDGLTVAVDTPEGVYLRTIVLSAQTWTGGGQYTLQLKVQDENTFEISTLDDLLELRDGVNSGSIVWQKVHAKLMNDIDCSSVTSWTPVGNGKFTPTESGTVSATWTEPAFKGTFDGQNHAIKNLKMTGTPAEYTPYGLFGILYGATVKDLVLGAASGDTGALTVTPQGRMDAGAVAGVAYGATVRNVINYDPMTLADNTSSARATLGMVGYVYGDAASGLSTLSELKNYGKVTATQSGSNTGNGATSVQVAGIAGFGNTGASSVINQISGSINYADIEVATGRCAGILAAANTRTAVSSCVNKGNIKNTFSNARIGGVSVILGAGASLTDCSNYGDVIATQANTHLGGLVCLLNNATAKVTGGGNYGRILGDITTYHGTIAANFSSLDKADDIVAGGAYGTYNGGDYTYTVLTEDNYMSYIGRNGSGNAQVTRIHFEAWDGYPTANETRISSAADLLAFAAKVNTGEFAATDVAVLTQDIDCSSITDWTPIGDYAMSSWSHVNLTATGHPFVGTFDGKNHRIKNLKMSFTNSGSYKAFGFFGCIGEGAAVKNLIFDASSSMTIAASFGGVFGVLAGMVLDATVDNVKNYASVTGGGTSSLANGANGRACVGALIGEVHPSNVPANISNLYNAGNIGTSETSLFDAGKNVQTGANTVHVGGIIGFATNLNNTTMVNLTGCTNDGGIFTNCGRASGLVAAANRYVSMKDCTNNGDVFNSFNGNSRLGNITCIAGLGSVLDGCINKGDLMAPNSASVAGVVCLVNDATVQMKNSGSHGATIVGKSVNLTGSQTYNGVLFGYCNNTATFSNCSVSGRIGTSKDNLVTLTADNYFQYVGQATGNATQVTATNIIFAE